ncbi:hypothetical protein CONPUDRAFT_160587 [Coniophora puteana RWD-64-598 SS2]|uniref:Uncharacterized protein n=1 Tax=Coniophora puteana (strain RWD-64-598) TaxID=741705 RepID=R7SDS6_CONPW|nr:uncharacterized protein CONPUDRAFT_160587 [Coniophora puteana RWD-64-598 SS2]EIW73907.1 hypothetical protein CONPUDRAFT_160587 [Coniophora puteana RWD-64-598 SS2]
MANTTFNLPDVIPEALRTRDMADWNDAQNVLNWLDNYWGDAIRYRGRIELAARGKFEEKLRQELRESSKFLNEMNGRRKRDPTYGVVFPLNVSVVMTTRGHLQIGDVAGVIKVKSDARVQPAPAVAFDKPWWHDPPYMPATAPPEDVDMDGPAAEQPAPEKSTLDAAHQLSGTTDATKTPVAAEGRPPTGKHTPTLADAINQARDDTPAEPAPPKPSTRSKGKGKDQQSGQETSVNEDMPEKDPRQKVKRKTKDSVAGSGDEQPTTKRKSKKAKTAGATVEQMIAQTLDHSNAEAEAVLSKSVIQRANVPPEEEDANLSVEDVQRRNLQVTRGLMEALKHVGYAEHATLIRLKGIEEAIRHLAQDQASLRSDLASGQLKQSKIWIAPGERGMGKLFKMKFGLSNPYHQPPSGSAADSSKQPEAGGSRGPAFGDLDADNASEAAGDE